MRRPTLTASARPAEDLGDGQTSFVVKCLEGYADINALYWNDGVADAIQFDLGTKKDNSLNMNGPGENWDGGVKLSSTGLGSDRLEKPTYLTAGEDYTKVATVDWATLDTLGVRATSTSTAEGSIKAVDNEPVIAGHKGNNLFTENFDGYATDPSFEAVHINWGYLNGNATEIVHTGAGGMPSTSGNYWMDTQATSGPIDISHTFFDPNGGKVQLSVDIGLSDVGFAIDSIQINDWVVSVS